MAEARSAFASGMGMSPEDLQEFVPSGQQTKFTNRVSWAKVYLEQAVLLESPRRGVFRITPRGCEVLKESPESIDLTFLSRFEEFRQFKQRRKPPTPPQITDSREEESTPLERLEEAHQQLQDELASDLFAGDQAEVAGVFREVGRQADAGAWLRWSGFWRGHTAFRGRGH